MDFEIISEVTQIEAIASGIGIRNRKGLHKEYGGKKCRDEIVKFVRETRIR